MILTCWGVHAVVWRGLHPALETLIPNPRYGKPRLFGRSEERSRYIRFKLIWGHVGSCFVWFLWLMGLFYIALDVSRAVVWLYVVHPSVLADVATKRYGFDVALSAFAFAFSIFIFAGAATTISLALLRDRASPSRGAPQYVAFLLAAACLLCRSIGELAVVVIHANAQRTESLGNTAAELALRREATFGTFDVLLLGCLWYVAHYFVPSALRDGGNPVKNAAEADVRRWILDTLMQRTRNHREQPPPLSELLDECRRQLLMDGDGSAGLAGDAGGDEMELQAMRSAAQKEFLAKLKRDYPNL